MPRNFSILYVYCTDGRIDVIKACLYMNGMLEAKEEPRLIS